MKRKSGFAIYGAVTDVMAEFYSRPTSVEEAVVHLRKHKWLIEQLPREIYSSGCDYVGSDTETRPFGCCLGVLTG